MDGGVLLLFIGIGLLIFFFGDREETKKELRNEIKYLESKLNGDDFKKLSLQTLRDIESKKKEANKEAKEIIDNGRKYVDELKDKAIKEIAKQREILQKNIHSFEKEKKSLIERNKFLEGMYSSFQQSYIAGREWLAEQYLETIIAKDFVVIDILKTKKNPAIKAADKLSEVQSERRELLKKYKLLEYQLRTYEEYFPFLVDYKNEILNDEIKGGFSIEKQSADPVNRFLSPEEYANLSITKKNQLALDRYVQNNLTKSEIGRMYERYIGSLYEQKGFDVQFIGIEKGLEDLGQDLVCIKNNEVIVIQAKCWSKNKVIRERHILQLFATTLLHQLSNPNKKVKYKSILFTTTELSDLAKDVAIKLGVEMKENHEMPKDYPMIKCNIGKNKEKIYHLPFDQMYDKVKINLKEGEFYAKTVLEAENKGFRRAFRWSGQS